MTIVVSDATLAANPDAYTTDAGATLTVAAPGVLANDTGTPAPAVTPATGPTVQGGSFTIAADGGFTYVPPAGFASPPGDRFGYTITNAGGSASATVGITVLGPEQAPFVASTNPVNGATGVGSSTSLIVTFSESVHVTSTAFSLECPVGTPIAFANATTSPATSFVLDPTPLLPPGATCTLRVTASEVSDADLDDPPNLMASDYTATFAVDAAPAVTSSTPPNGGGALVDDPITLVFSEPVDATGSAFTLECPVGTPILFTPTASPATTFVLDPVGPLPAGATCTVTVVSSQISDTDAGDPPNIMASDYVFTFTLDAAPSVTSTVPANAATGVANDANLTVTFSESVSLTGSAVTLECPVGVPIPVTNTTASPATSFVLDPAPLLPAGVTCAVTVAASQVTDTDANDPPDTLTADSVFTFTTDAAPSVASTLPANGATNVGPTADVSITFSESVHVTGTAFTLECPVGSPVAFTNTTPSPATTFVLDPTAPLPSGTSCTVGVVASQVTDADANDPPTTMAADYSFAFTTDAAPTVTSTMPSNGAASVGSDTSISITFSEAVNATGSAFTLECPAATPIVFTSTTASPATTFVLDPTPTLPAGTICTVGVAASQITDQDANDPPDTMAADVTVTFTTDAAPTVSSTVPANGGNMLVGDNISVTFSESVSVTASAFALECPVGTPMPFTNTTASPATTFLLDPTGNLPTGATCTASVVAAQVTDTDAGDPPDTMAANYVFTFGTDPPPSVTATTPVNGATTVTATANLTVTFSEAVNVSGNWFQIVCATSGTRNVADTVVTGGPTTFTIDPTTDFAAGESCTATVLAAQVADQDANDPPDTMAANDVFSFTIDAAASVASTTPANGAANQAVDTDLTITFSEPVYGDGQLVPDRVRHERHAQRRRHGGDGRADHVHHQSDHGLRDRRALHDDGHGGAGDRSGCATTRRTPWRRTTSSASRWTRPQRSRARRRRTARRTRWRTGT